MKPGERISVSGLERLNQAPVRFSEKRHRKKRAAPRVDADNRSFCDYILVREDTGDYAAPLFLIVAFVGVYLAGGRLSRQKPGRIRTKLIITVRLFKSMALHRIVIISLAMRHSLPVSVFA